MPRKLIETSEAPKPVGPYSQAVTADGFAWISMQLPLDPATGAMDSGETIEEAARRTLENLRTVCRASGAELSDVLKVTVYFADLADFDRVNKIYAEFFGTSKPARAALQAAALPRGARIAMDAVARVKTA